MRQGLSGAEELNGFMDEGTEFIGELRFKNTFRIDGKLKGKVVSDHTITWGSRVRWKPRSNARFSIKGAVAERCWRASASSSFRRPRAGHPDLARLVIEEGAVFQGQCDMARRLPSPRAADGSRAAPMSEGRS